MSAVNSFYMFSLKSDAFHVLDNNTVPAVAQNFGMTLKMSLEFAFIIGLLPA